MLKFRMHFAVSLFLCFLIVATNVYGQRGRIVGQVVEKGTGSPLIAANVFVVGTNLGAATDGQGNYIIGRVPPGTYKVRVFYIGYKDVTKEVKVQANRTARLDFALTTTMIQTNAVVVTAERLAQSQSTALNNQYNALNIRNVISSDLIGSFPDEQASESLARIPGVFMDGDRAILRGMPAEYSFVAVNGQKIPAIASDVDRASSMTTFPVDLIQSIEVSKTTTPDMPADVIAGQVNLVLKDAPSRRVFSFKGYSGMTPNYSGKPVFAGKLIRTDKLHFFGPIKASITVGDNLLNGKFGYIFGLTYERESQSKYREKFAWNFSDKYWNRYYASTDINGVLQERGKRYYKQYYYESITDRRGINASILYKPSVAHKLFAKAFYATHDYLVYENNTADRFEYYKKPNKENMVDGYIQRQHDVKTEPEYVATLGIGGEHHFFGDWKVDWGVHYTTGEGGEEHQIQNRYELDREDYYAGERDLLFQDYNAENEIFLERDIITSLNVTKPFSISGIRGFVKTGLRTKHHYRYQRKLDQVFEPTDPDDLADPEEYKPWTINLYGEYEDALYAPDNVYLKTDDDTKLWDNYTATEQINAAYIMTPTWLTNHIMVLPGVRIEKTETKSKPRLIKLFYQYNPEEVGGGKFATGTKGSYTDVFPSLTLRFKLPLGLDLRMAGTKGISRPSFKQTVGFADLNSDSTTLRLGNPDLRPTRSSNIDVILEHYSTFMAGVVSAGFFYKEITDVAQEQEFADYLWTSPDGDQIEVENMRRWENIGKGFVKGIEFSLQRQLDFIGLPQVGILANWTHQLDTYLMTPEGEKEKLPTQADDVYNLALSFESAKLGFSGRLAYHHVSEILRQTRFSYKAREFRDPYERIDLTLNKDITKNIRAFFIVRNLTNEDSKTSWENLRKDRPKDRYLYEINHGQREFRFGFNVNLK